MGCEWSEFKVLQTHEDRERTLMSCSPEARVDLYVRYSFSTLPLNHHLLDVAARGGEEIVSIVIQRVEEAVGAPESELAIPELLFLLSRMSQRGYLSPDFKSTLLPRLNKAIEAMSHAGLREEARHELRRIARE